MIGRRVNAIELIENPGDYCVIFADVGSIKALWFKLPNDHGDWGATGRIANEGHGHTRGGRTEPEWEISLEPDGSVTVSPSIDSKGGVDWHGWLERGVWRDA